MKAALAFVEAMSWLGSLYHNQYSNGNRDVIAALSAEETNLLHARRQARTHGWDVGVIKTMQGLRVLYSHSGRRSAWVQAVDEILPNFVDPNTDGPLPGREEMWSVVTEYRVHLAMEAREWVEAERLQLLCIDWDRRRAASALATSTEDLNDTTRNVIRSQAVSVNDLGQIELNQGKAECIAAFQESYDLSLRIGDQPLAALAALSLGHAYKDIPYIRDLTLSEHWYQRSLELRDERDQKGRGGSIAQLGRVTLERFTEGTETKQPEELLKLLNTSLRFYEQALALLPADAADDLSVIHNQIGNINFYGGNLQRALSHWRDSIRLKEMTGNTYGAALTRNNVAAALAQVGRLADAREYASAALRNFETYGDRAAADIQKAEELIAFIEQALERV